MYNEKGSIIEEKFYGLSWNPDKFIKTIRKEAIKALTGKDFLSEFDNMIVEAKYFSFKNVLQKGNLDSSCESVTPAGRNSQMTLGFSYEATRNELEKFFLGEKNDGILYNPVFEDVVNAFAVVKGSEDDNESDEYSMESAENAYKRFIFNEGGEDDEEGDEEDGEEEKDAPAKYVLKGDVDTLNITLFFAFHDFKFYKPEGKRKLKGKDFSNPNYLEQVSGDIELRIEKVDKDYNIASFAWDLERTEDMNKPPTFKERFSSLMNDAKSGKLGDYGVLGLGVKKGLGAIGNLLTGGAFKDKVNEADIQVSMKAEFMKNNNDNDPTSSKNKGNKYSKAAVKSGAKSKNTFRARYAAALEDLFSETSISISENDIDEDSFDIIFKNTNKAEAGKKAVIRVTFK